MNQVVDSTGRLIKEVMIEIGLNSYEIDDVNQGVYVLEIIDEITLQKLVKRVVIHE